jgi:hypothetical protein
MVNIFKESVTLHLVIYIQTVSKEKKGHAPSLVLH